MPIILQDLDPNGTPQRSMGVVIGNGLSLGTTSDGLALIESGGGSDGELRPDPSGDDTAAFNSVAFSGAVVRLGPGTFHVASTIYIGDGTTFIGAGTGAAAGTIVQATASFDSIFTFGDGAGNGGIQSMRLIGMGSGAAAGSSAIKCARTNSLPHMTGFRFRDLAIDGFSDAAFYIDACDQVELTNVAITNVANDVVSLNEVFTAALRAVTVTSSGRAFYIYNSTGISLSGCEAASGSSASFELDGCTGCVLDACTSRSAIGNPLSIQGGSGIAVNGFLSDDSAGGSTSRPHLIVAGASDVVVNGFIRTTAATNDADVGAAAGVVLVSAHNFDTATVISGGKFAQPSYTTLP